MEPIDFSVVKDMVEDTDLTIMETGADLFRTLAELIN
jgi:hypothetical protein